MTKEKMKKVFATDGDQLLRFCMMVIYAELDMKGTDQGHFERDSGNANESACKE